MSIRLPKYNSYQIRKRIHSFHCRKFTHQICILQFLILLLTFLGISNAKPAISNRGKDPFNGPPKPFSFKYGVTDEETGSNFDHAQQQDSNGVVTGKIF